MTTAILIHGCWDRDEFMDDRYPSPSNSHWFPWLQKQLLKAGIEAQTPEMPTPYMPVYERWKELFERFDINGDTVLVGHSCGACFLLRWLSENRIGVRKLVLVAPWLDPEKEFSSFSDFELSRLSESGIWEIHVFHSIDDPVIGVEGSVKIILDALPNARLHTFEKTGHFTLESMGRTDFPELLEAIAEKL